MEIINTILINLAKLLFYCVFMALFWLVFYLAVFAYRKLWQWLNRRLGRTPKSLLDKDDSVNYATQLVFMVGMALGVLSASNAKPGDWTNPLADYILALTRMMLGGFLGLCLAEVVAYLYELEITVLLRNFLASIPIIQSIAHRLKALAVLVSPVVRRINHWLDSLNALTERIVQHIPTRWAVIISCVGMVFGCVFLYVNVYALDAASYQQGQSRASDVLAALQTYKYATGKYPATLDDLVPQYILQIPRPARHYEYKYLTCRQGAGYLLYYRLQGTAGTYCGYGDKLFAWQCIPISTARFQNSSCDVPK